MELVVVAISGVQRFISESLSTADLHAGSALMAELAWAMLTVVPPSRLVLPSKLPDEQGRVPSRVVVLSDDGAGRDLAGKMAKSAQAAWEKRLARALSGKPVPKTPGFPAVQWVVAPFEDGGYAEGWSAAQAALRARKRIRGFPGYHVRPLAICTLTGRWAAEPPSDGGRSKSVAHRREALSAVGYVKFRYGRQESDRFPSTWSIATAPYRDAIIRVGEDDAEVWGAAVDLKDACERLGAAGESRLGTALRRSSTLRGLATSTEETLRWLNEVEGSWCLADSWDPAQLRRAHDLAEDPDHALCMPGREAARRLVRKAQAAGIPAPSSYLAVLAQDADHLGERLGRFPQGIDPVTWQRQVSAALDNIAGRQVDDIELSHLGRVVYAGGDDLLALVPAERVLAAAREANRLFADDHELNELLDKPSASSAIVFFHASWPLQSAIAAARELLKDAKKRSRPGLGITVLTRGGERTRVVLPWLDRSGQVPVPAITHLEDLVAATAGPLSGRLASGLEVDRDALSELSQEWLERELARRALRHGIAAGKAPAVGRLLASLCVPVPGGRDFTDCADSLLVARFVAGQARVPA
ncbi:MAG TPA: type III-B CRISPR-associated protein Cas10/Cmr2 [Streptosporangiaceae bacterium]|nr:type III-B CRISPR-associated protein Cas10/Cmr2 [Streptosporangiaceae bacterium]